MWIILHNLIHMSLFSLSPLQRRRTVRLVTRLKPYPFKAVNRESPRINFLLISICSPAKKSMHSLFTPRPIGYARTPYTVTSQIPKGLNAKHDVEGVLEILPEFAAGLKDVEGFSHLFVLWVFDRSTDFDLIATPPSDEGRQHGVFATRSPRRPNPIGLTVAQLIGRDGANLRVRGVDMLEGTPILDIKPYLSSIPQEELRRGWLMEAEARAKR
jgi:tRNA-Thr(GGU) m(6)t(6)A37 methyltransferase TsaA